MLALLKFMNKIKEQLKFPKSLRLSNITTLFKKGKDMNIRPIEEYSEQQYSKLY